ncbi:MAG: Plug domain-containing protein, partial [Deltaproteobacteria bacterium]|nr:Plug domain-containing protein [Deltaproteobacteria bacterium]
MQEDINEIIQMLGEEELSDDYSKQKLIRKESPAHKVVITSGEIEEAGYRTLGEILDYVNGMYAVSDKNYTHIGVRGFNRPSSNNNHIQVLVDGHPLNEGVYGGAGFGHT